MTTPIVGPASARPLASCQCPRWPTSGSCARQATQEDLLCDPCRKGCSAAGFAPVGTPAGQIPMTNGHMEQVTTVWGGLLPNDQEAGGEIFVRVWSLDGGSTPDRPVTQEAS